MPIQFQKTTAIFKDMVTVDEAEALLSFLQKKSSARIDLSGCQHLHAANLQVLMAARPNIVAWPQDAEWATWLKSALT